MSASSGSSASAAAVKAAVGVEMAALKVAAEEEFNAICENYM